MVAVLLVTGGALIARTLWSPPEVGVMVQVVGDVPEPGWFETAQLAEALALAGAELEVPDAELGDGTVVVVEGDMVRLRAPETPLVFELPVDLNTASEDALQAIPGVGPSLARGIVDGRPYDDVDELVEVRGIGPATLDAIRPFVAVTR